MFDCVNLFVCLSATIRSRRKEEKREKRNLLARLSLSEVARDVRGIEVESGVLPVVFGLDGLFGYKLGTNNTLKHDVSVHGVCSDFGHFFRLELDEGISLEVSCLLNSFGSETSSKAIKNEE